MLDPVFIDENFFYPLIFRFFNFWKKKKNGLIIRACSAIRVQKCVFFTAKYFSWVTILGSRCFCGQVFFKQKKRMNKLVKLVIWDIASFKGGVTTTWVLYDVRQILWCNLSHLIALHADLKKNRTSMYLKDLARPKF